MTLHRLVGWTHELKARCFCSGFLRIFRALPNFVQPLLTVGADSNSRSVNPASVNQTWVSGAPNHKITATEGRFGALGGFGWNNVFDHNRAGLLDGQVGSVSKFCGDVSKLLVRVSGGICASKGADSFVSNIQNDIQGARV